MVYGHQDSDATSMLNLPIPAVIILLSTLQRQAPRFTKPPNADSARIGSQGTKTFVPKKRILVKAAAVVNSPSFIPASAEADPFKHQIKTQQFYLMWQSKVQVIYYLFNATLIHLKEKVERDFRPDTPNPPANLVIRTEISGLGSIPDHQQGIICRSTGSRP